MLLVVSLDATLREVVEEVLNARDFVAGVRLLFHPYPRPLFGAAGGRGVDGVLVVKQVSLSLSLSLSGSLSLPLSLSLSR